MAVQNTEHPLAELEDVNGLYTIEQAARVLGLKPDTLYWRLRHQDVIKPRRIGRQMWLLTAADVMRLWQDEHEKLLRTQRG